MKRIVAIAGMLLFAMHVFAQNDKPDPDVKGLMLTSSPAYVLLGVQPENIQRPSTPRDFIGGVQTATVNGQLQPNFAMEFNPFNWGSKTKSNQFYANDYFYSSAAAIKKNFALSIATSTSDTVVFGNLKKGLGLGYGLRATILPGKVNEITRKLFSAWEFAEVKSIFTDAINTQLLMDEATIFTDAKLDEIYATIAEAVKKKTDILEENKDALLAKLKVFIDGYKGLDKASFNKKIEADAERIATDKNNALASINARKVPFDRQGFTLELALAGVTVFQENEFSGSYHGKTALWLTPAYRFNLATEDDKDLTKSMDIMGILRFVWNASPIDPADYFDTGIKFQFNKAIWNFSFEGTGRHATVVPENVKSKWTYSWLTSFSYTINSITTLRFSFGSAFNGNTATFTEPNKMFALGGVNFGLF